MTLTEQLRKHFSTILLLILSFGCSKNQESIKLNNAIEEYMNQTLDNPKSYEPISTIIIDTIYNVELIEFEKEKIKEYKNQINILNSDIDNLVKDLYYYDLNIEKNIKIKNLMDFKKQYFIIQNKIIKFLPKKDKNRVIKDSISYHFALQKIFLDAGHYNGVVFSNIYKPIKLWELYYEIILKMESIEHYNEMIKNNYKSIHELNNLIYKSGYFSYNSVKLTHEFRATNEYNAIVKKIIYFNYDLKTNILYELN